MMRNLAWKPLPYPFPEGWERVDLPPIQASEDRAVLWIIAPDEERGNLWWCGILVMDSQQSPEARWFAQAPSRESAKTTMTNLLDTLS